MRPIEEGPINKASFFRSNRRKSCQNIVTENFDGSVRGGWIPKPFYVMSTCDGACKKQENMF